MTNTNSMAKTAKTKTTTKTLRETALHLKGNWLEAVGFTTEQPVTITSKKDKLIA